MGEGPRDKAQGTISFGVDVEVTPALEAAQAALRAARLQIDEESGDSDSGWSDSDVEESPPAGVRRPPPSSVATNGLIRGHGNGFGDAPPPSPRTRERLQSARRLDRQITEARRQPAALSPLEQVVANLSANAASVDVSSDDSGPVRGREDSQPLRFAARCNLLKSSRAAPPHISFAAPDLHAPCRLGRILRQMNGR